MDNEVLVISPVFTDEALTVQVFDILRKNKKASRKQPEATFINEE